MKNFAARELAMLAAIDAALHKETSPEVVVLCWPQGRASRRAQSHLRARAARRRPPRAARRSPAWSCSSKVGLRERTVSS